MDNQEFDRLTTVDNGMSVILEFPKNSSDNSNLIIQDIKDILKSILFEYLEKVS